MTAEQKDMAAQCFRQMLDNDNYKMVFRERDEQEAGTVITEYTVTLSTDTVVEFKNLPAPKKIGY